MTDQKTLAECSTQELAAELRRRNLVKATPEELVEELKRRQDDAEAPLRSTDPNPKFVDIEALLDDRPQVSPQITQKIGGKEKTFHFRSLSRAQMEKAEGAGAGYIVKANEEFGLPYEHVNAMEVQERLAGEKELRILCAVCVKLSGGNVSPAFNMDWLRSNITASEQTELFRKWEAWYTKDVWNTNDLLEEEAFRGLVEDIKKNDLSFWINCEFSLLTRCLLTSVSRPEWLQTSKPSDT